MASKWVTSHWVKAAVVVGAAAVSLITPLIVTMTVFNQFRKTATNLAVAFDRRVCKITGVSVERLVAILVVEAGSN
jgi:hypothetical protein